MSFKAEVKVGPDWGSNELRFAGYGEAEAYARDLFTRWTTPTAFRVVPADGPPTHVFVDGALSPIEAK